MSDGNVSPEVERNTSLFPKTSNYDDGTKFMCTTHTNTHAIHRDNPLSISNYRNSDFRLNSGTV